ncbi:MAG: 4-alpha-glucanotransferase, partial [Chloroflexota bacterium]
YGWIIPYHTEKLALAYEGYQKNGTPEQKAAFEAFVEEQKSWLEDYALFAALKHKNGGKPWVEWENEALIRYDADAVKQARKDLADDIEEQQFRQWIFYKQWNAVKKYAGEKGIRIFGDIPIFVAHDSADVWGNQDLFYLEEDGHPTVIAGVPPDYYSPTGQRWGNPLYKWDAMKENDYAWWISRFNAAFELVDYVRIDHFRGFEAYWEIPSEEETAINGEWIPGPGQDFFRVIKDALGELPIIAEDLGVITEGVEALRDGFDLPGMKVLQFAWSEPTNPFLPHNHVENCVVYTGTHDNNTTIGWFHDEVDEGTLDFMQKYLSREVHEINWTMIQTAMMSPAHTAIFPMQDILNLGSEARMNTPGKQGGNWSWRFTEDAFNQDGKDRLGYLSWLYRRRPEQQTKTYGDVAVK